MSAIMIGGAGSGSGKTTVTCGILKALLNRGIGACSCKCGPDYIDPMFHERVLGIKSKNLDKFFCDDNLLKYLFNKQEENSEITVVEGVMGYYDGLSLTSTEASSYDIARTLNMPAVLVINARGMAMSAIALIQGMIDFKKDSNIKAVILNNVSEAVYQGLKPVIERELNIKALGYMPYNKDYSLESRHLGLITPMELKDIEDKIALLGIQAEKTIDIEGLINLAKTAKKVEYKPVEPIKKGKKVKIAVAYDNAFCFYYKDNLELLEEMNLQVEFFSPLKDKELPKDTRGLILGGGYPELYLKELSENKPMLSSIYNALECGLPTLAECGGFMYLHELIDGFKGVGIIKGAVTRQKGLVRFGYAELVANEDTPYLSKGKKIKAHEFHYWDSTQNGNSFKAVKPNGRQWQCINCYKNLVCGFPHLFYYSDLDFIYNFAERCRQWCIH